METETGWMQRALELARGAQHSAEVPVGAVIVQRGVIIGEGGNQRRALCDPTAHAEIVALRQACRQVGDWRLGPATLYVTLEPCLMCLAALLEARIRRIVIGALDSKRGAVVSNPPGIVGIPCAAGAEVVSGVLAEECGRLLSGFFADRRG